MAAGWLRPRKSDGSFERVGLVLHQELCVLAGDTMEVDERTTTVDDRQHWLEPWLPKPFVVIVR